MIGCRWIIDHASRSRALTPIGGALPNSGPTVRDPAQHTAFLPSSKRFSAAVKHSVEKITSAHIRVTMDPTGAKAITSACARLIDR